MKKIKHGAPYPLDLLHPLYARLRYLMQVTARLALTLVCAACGGGGSSGAIPSTVSTVCGYEVGAERLDGTVTEVHDGDTISVGSTRVRLDSIDAPESAQTYGTQSQAQLSALVLGKTVKVAYAKTDRYGRVVGSVFTSGCKYINLEHVKTGAAWYYRAYQCEISAVARNELDQAELAAKAARKGLWSESSPTAPWVYRNGFSPDVPVCTSDSQ